jgi:hypothetical protein
MHCCFVLVWFEVCWFVVVEAPQVVVMMSIIRLFTASLYLRPPLSSSFLSLAVLLVLRIPSSIRFRLPRLVLNVSSQDRDINTRRLAEHNTGPSLKRCESLT